MAIQTSYSSARANLAKLCSKVSDDREVVIIQRRGREDVALISADELESLSETAYLLSSPRNRRRLLTALRASRSGKGKRMSTEALRAAVGL